jgi:asparagine synthase (glutamine-hydrolysing)
MSGFVAVWQRDGRPVDAAQLGRLTAALRFRGPDGAGTWSRGGVGLGHARLVTDAQRDGVAQPFDLDQRYWITGDIRLDAREELIAVLCHSERSEESLQCSDAALVLRAYRAWGPDCLTYLHGDFAFAIWDETAQRLFCARDRFGVRPFFYAQFPDLLVLGNTLDAVRRHPRVSNRPHEAALADYLVVGNLLEHDRSFLADVRRLPPAHALTVERGGVTRVARYWSLPAEPELRDRRDGEVLEQFAELLSRAVADRSPPGRVALFLSGGLDSAAIAATLAGKLGTAPAHCSPHGIALGWNRSFADAEPALAQATAHALGLPLTVHEFADCEPFRSWDSAQGIGPEPEDDFYRSHTIDSLRLAATDSRVALFGRGGDEILAHETLTDELRRGAGLSAMTDAAAHWIRSGRRPPLGLRSALKLGPAGPASWIQVPSWIAPDWIAPLRMGERLQALSRAAATGPRGHARYRLGAARWTAGFEFADPGYTGVAVDCRYPLIDERIVRFALRLPPLRWCADKALLRRALAPVLPDAARRPKVLLAGEPLLAWSARKPAWPQELRHDAAVLEGRVDAAAWAQAWEAPAAPEEEGIGRWRLARVSALARWLGVNNLLHAPLEAVA